MNSKINQLIMQVLNTNDLKLEYEKMKSFVNELIQDYDITTKTELLSCGFSCMKEIFEETKRTGKLNINTINLITTINCKLFFDCVISMDTDAIDFTHMYTITKLSGEINEQLHPYLQLMIKISLTLENCITFLYDEYDNIATDYYFYSLEKQLQTDLSTYVNDDSDWNKILFSQN